MQTEQISVYLVKGEDVSQFILNLTRLERQAKIRELLAAGYMSLYGKDSKQSEQSINTEHRPHPVKKPQANQSTPLRNLNAL